MTRWVKEQACAKINLTLDVLFKRPDGYHEVAMIMQSIDLADTIILEDRPDEISVDVNRPDLAADNTNLAYRAAALLKRRCDVTRGVHLTIEKKIPLAAGLAGGSADAAAVLRGLNALWGLHLSAERLEKLGAELGSDVPFCLRGGTVLATGRGETLARLAPMPACHVVLAKPADSVSTAWVYSQYRPENAYSHPDTAGVLACLEQGDLSGIARRLCNVLESVTIPAHPVIGLLKQNMLQNGAMASLMSGSGPTVFGLVANAESAATVAAGLTNFVGTEVFVAKTVGGEDGVQTNAN